MAVRTGWGSSRGGLESSPDALRAERPDERRGHPRGEVDRRLRLPLVRQEVPDDRAAGGGGDPLARGEGAARCGLQRQVSSWGGGEDVEAPAPGQTALFNAWE